MAPGWPVPEAGGDLTHSWQLPWGGNKSETVPRAWDKRKPPEICMWGFRMLYLAPTAAVESDESGPAMPVNIPGTYIHLCSTHIYLYSTHTHIYICVFVNVCISISLAAYINISWTLKTQQSDSQGLCVINPFPNSGKRHTHRVTHPQWQPYTYAWSFEVFHYGNIIKSM